MNKKADYGNLKEKSIEIRLEGVATSTSRARKSFLILTIFCAAINIALWNSYLSWVREIAMPAAGQESTSDEDPLACACNSVTLSWFISEIKQRQPEKAKHPDPTPIPAADQDQSVSAMPANSARNNKRILVDEWIRSQTISINILGIRLSTFDLAVLGSLSLIIIVMWHFFVVRRENRAIVPFLKDIYDESLGKRENSLTVLGKSDLANIVFLGMANSILFINIAEDDNPAKFSISDGKSKMSFSNHRRVNLISLCVVVFMAAELFALWAIYVASDLSVFLGAALGSSVITFLLIACLNLLRSDCNNRFSFTEWWKKNENQAFLFRWLLELLVFLPSITIFLIILSDVSSLFSFSAFRQPDRFLIENACLSNPQILGKVAFFESVAFISFLMVTHLSLKCVQFTRASADSLHEFFRQLFPDSDGTDKERNVHKSKQVDQ